MNLQETSERMYEIFKGMENAHGTYNLTNSTGKENGKISGAAAVIHEPLTATTWRYHLLGQQGLGIGPLDNESMCGWGAIDIDKYDLNHKELIDKIKLKKLPLLCARTKSGGAHLYCFFQDRLDAQFVKDKMTAMAIILGYAFIDDKPIEVFPKQIKVLTERGDTSNWLNMPYLGALTETGELTHSENRYFFDPETATPWSLEDFLNNVDRLRVNDIELNQIEVKKELNDPILTDAPICLQQILAAGPIEEGYRNIMMYNLAVFSKKVAGDNLEYCNTLIENFNRKYCSPMLSASEIVKIQETIAKHPEYQYNCKDPKLKSYCNVPLCKNQKYGLSAAVTMPILSDAVKVVSDPCIYFLTVDDVRIELTTDELYDQNKFAKKCIDAVNVMPPKLKHEEWRQMVNNLLSTRREIIAPDEISRLGKFNEIMEDFSKAINPQFTREDIARDLPYYNKEKGELWFRMKALETYLTQQRLQYARSDLFIKLKAMKGKDKQVKIANKNYNIWCVPMDDPTLQKFDVDIKTEADLI